MKFDFDSLCGALYSDFSFSWNIFELSILNHEIEWHISNRVHHHYNVLCNTQKPTTLKCEHWFQRFFDEKDPFMSSTEGGE